jgi:hypothetical protein
MVYLYKDLTLGQSERQIISTLPMNQFLLGLLASLCVLCSPVIVLFFMLLGAPSNLSDVEFQFYTGELMMFTKDDRHFLYDFDTKLPLRGYEQGTHSLFFSSLNP